MEQAHFLIKELYIVSVPQFNRYGSLYPALLAATASLIIYYRSVGNHIGHKNYIYTKLWKCTKKNQINDLNSPRNEPIIVLDYWSNNIEEDFHLRNPNNIYIFEKPTTKDVTDLMNVMVKHVKYMEQVMIRLQ